MEWIETIQKMSSAELQFVWTVGMSQTAVERFCTNSIHSSEGSIVIRDEDNVYR